MKILKAILPLVVLAVGAYLVVKLIETRPTAPRSDTKPLPVLVQVIEAESVRRQVTVEAMGTVVPARSLVVFPEVTGRIIEHSPQLVPGGRFSAGDLIARIDPRDYELAVERAKANVERARFELEVEKGRQIIAQREWTLLDPDVAGDSPSRDLALRKPHQRNAEATLAAAQSNLDLATLRLDRTTIRAPFNALVLDESVDVGQLVTPQTRLATLVGTDEFWVDVTVPVDRLGFIDIPGTFGAPGSTARVVYAPGPDTRIECAGRVLGLKGALDPVGRMAQLLVQVENPLDPPSADDLPLLLDAYVRVQIEGKTLEDVFVLPRAALREGVHVWVMNDADELEIRTVAIAWRREDTVWLRGGIHPGERIVTSRVAAPVPGMKLRVGQSEAAGEPVAQPASQPPVSS